jgi:lysozyme family protein
MTFEAIIDRVLSSEGGYVNNPADPGGETQWGISKRAYPNLDIKGLTRGQAVIIYKRDFWVPIGGDSFPQVLGFQLLDFAVNSGISTAIRKLQTATGVADDGHWGPISAAKAAATSPAALTFNFLAERLDFMRKLSVWPSFSSGWAGRIATDMRYAAVDLLIPA